MATYLATVNIAEFGLILEEGPRGMPLRLYHPLDATEAELAEFARTAEMMEFFEELFGPYPFECYGGVLAYEQIGGALETQTLPVYGRGCNEAVLAHEMAHQWFGNAVSPATWSEMWLNEGFASYAEFLWFEYVRGPEAAEARVQGMYRMLRARRVGPAADPGVERLFGANTYVRGGWVLHQLRRAVGDEVFFEILRTWGELHHDGVGTTEGFLELCDRVSGRELGEFLGELLYAEVVPVDPDYEEEEVEGR
jgi:aminopeptidase N